MLGAIGPAQAGLVNVQFGGDFNSPQAQVGPAVIGSAGDVWNQMWGISGNTGSGALVDTDGNATGLSISFTTQGWLQVPEGLTVWGTDYRNLMRGMIYTDTATTRNITITGLPANAEHELYVYAQGDSGSNGRQTKLTPAGGTPVITTATVATADTFILDQNLRALGCDVRRLRRVEHRLHRGDRRGQPERAATGRGPSSGARQSRPARDRRRPARRGPAAALAAGGLIRSIAREGATPSPIRHAAGSGLSPVFACLIGRRRPTNQRRAFARE
jgi:hypothetical protein